MNIFEYKLDEEVNIKFKDLIFFLDSFYGRNINYSFEEIELWDGEYSFTGNNRVNGFYDILLLNYFGIINLNILNYNNRGDLGFNTNIDLSYLDKSKLDCSLEDYLYKNIYDYIDGIEQHSSMLIYMTFRQAYFIRFLMKIIFQEYDIKLLSNYKIYDDLIDYINLNKEDGNIKLSYDISDYLDNKNSIYPILVELEKKKRLSIKGIELLNGIIYFELEKILNLNDINKRDIIEIFGSKDKYIGKSKNKDITFNGSKIICGGKEKILTGKKLLLAEYIFFYNNNDDYYDWQLVKEHLYTKNYVGEGIINSIKKLNTEFKNIGSKLRLGYSEGTHIYIK